jgi:hypothetical protein
MNPTINKKIIERAFEEDPQAAHSEWSAEWRKDIEALIPPELVEDAVISRRRELEKVSDVEYKAFTDPSGGRQDSFTLAISHRDENGKIILDLIREAKPPFVPEDVVKEFSSIIKSYSISEVESDKFAGEWVTDSFRRNGITVRNSVRSKSQIYLEFLPLISGGRLELLDQKEIAVQLTSLERKTRPGGRDSIDNFYGHDDVANAVAGACVMAALEEDTGPGFVYHGGMGEVQETQASPSDDESWVYSHGAKSSVLPPESEDIAKTIREEVKQRAEEIYSKHGYVSPMGIAHSMRVSFEVVKDHLLKLGYREVKKNEFIPKEVDDLN